MAEVLVDGESRSRRSCSRPKPPASTSRRPHRPRVHRGRVVHRPGPRTALREALEGQTEAYDYVLIDCPPNLGLLTLNGLVAAEGVIIPVQTQYYALKGFNALVNVITRSVRSSTAISVLGLLPTFFDSRTILATDMLEELRDRGRSPRVQKHGPQTVTLGEAPLVGSPMTTYAGSASGRIPTVGSRGR